MTKNTHHCLVEALRRTAFHQEKWNLDTLQAKWLGLGYPSTYKDAVAEGYMVCTVAPFPRISSWYKLTEKGARLVASWIDLGYGPKNCNEPQYLRYLS